MADIVETISIARSTDEVWAVLADFGGIAQWAPNVDHSRLTTDHGDRVGAARRVQIGRNALLERVLEWTPGETLTYKIEGLPPLVRSVTNAWHLDEVGASTSVTLTSTVHTGPRPPQQLIARVVGRGLANASREMLAGLKAHLEEGAA